MGKEEVQTIQWVKKRYRQYNGQRRGTDNTMGKEEVQTIQWVKKMYRQYNG
jgi:hypothetical protein